MDRDALSGGGTRTPARWHVWVIGAIGLLWSGMGVISLVLTQMNVEAVMARFPPQQREYFESFPLWIVAFWSIAVLAGVIGCLLLLLKHRLAVPALLASAVGAVVYNAAGLFLLGGLQVMRETGGLGFTLAPVLFSLFLALYASAISRNGVLR